MSNCSEFTIWIKYQSELEAEHKKSRIYKGATRYKCDFSSILLDHN